MRYFCSNKLLYIYPTMRWYRTNVLHRQEKIKKNMENKLAISVSCIHTSTAKSLVQKQFFSFIWDNWVEINIIRSRWQIELKMGRAFLLDLGQHFGADCSCWRMLLWIQMLIKYPNWVQSCMSHSNAKSRVNLTLILRYFITYIITKDVHVIILSNMLF
jgi:hypothetical protein